MSDLSGKAVFEQIAAATRSRIVLVRIAIDANTSVLVQGYRFSNSSSRALSHHAMQNNEGFSVWIPTEDIADVGSLPGKTATIDEKTSRILAVKIHALDGIALLTIGNYEQVTA